MKNLSCAGKIISLIMILTALSGCAQNGGTEDITAAPQASQTEETAVTRAETAAAPAETSAVQQQKKEVKPLTPGKGHAYFENEDFSVTVQLTTLQSSLYYPDIVHDIGADPEVFTMTASVTVKNMSGEEKAFDCTSLTIPGMIQCGGETEKFSSIAPGKAASGTIRFLCSLEQAGAVDGILCGNEYLESREEFYPKKFNEIIKVQSADDVREHLYRKFVMRGAQEGYHTLNSSPTIYQMHHIKAAAVDGKNYLSVTYTAYNRSDYAQLIDPSAFILMCLKDGQEPDAYAGTKNIYPLYISTSKDHMYEPKEVSLKLPGTKQLYELPEFICMNPDNPTEFTVIYDFADFSVVVWLWFEGFHEPFHAEPYYSDLEDIGFKAIYWDAWEEKYIYEEE